MSDKQKTIKNSVTISGKGLHTGLDCCLTFKPAAENSGFNFKRIDLANSPTVKAIIENVVDTSRGTSIEENGVRIGTIEHVLAAVYGLGIDNILIELDAPEIPILDGSSKYFVDLLEKAEIIDQNAEKRYFTLKNNVHFKENGVEYLAIPNDNFSLNVLIDYNSSVILNQYSVLNNLSDFKNEISSCRTFVFLHELNYLLNNNLIKGGDIENAIVIIDTNISKEELNKLADAFNQPRLEVIPKQGILNNVDLYFNNEPARHKLLDLTGDLALIGKPLKAKIIATKPGHKTNIEFAKKIKAIIKKEAIKNSAPIIDWNKPPILDINTIRKLLPHRPPFLLVDKILEMTDTSVIGLKNVTMNEDFFVGHFPNEPLMPGVLIIEAMAQVGGILVLSRIPDPENYSTYLLKIEHVKYKKKVIPGDTIIFKLELTSPIRRGIANMVGKAYVGENIVMEGEMMAQISKIN